MKRTLTLTIALIAFLSSHAELNRSVVNLISYDGAGKILKSASAVVCGEGGEILAAYSCLEGACSAEVIDCKGKSYKVTEITGASRDFDLVRFRVDKGKKLDVAPVSAPSESGVFVVRAYSNDKNYAGEAVTFVSREKYEPYEYYTLSVPNDAKYFGCPVFDAEGRLVAIVQQNLTKNASTACAIDARFGTDLQIKSTSAMSDDLARIGLPKALPEGEEEAYSYLYLLSMRADSIGFVTAANAFQERYPKNVNALVLLGTYYANRKDYSSCEAMFKKALKSGVDADNVHANYSDAIYNKVLKNPQPAYADWTLEKALSEAEKAYELRPDTIYFLRQAHCLYGLKRYAEARDKYVAVARNTPVGARDVWYFAARSEEMAGGAPEKVIALIDSALTCVQKPYDMTAASFFVARAQQYEKADMARKAVMDYNEYEKIVGPRNLTANFYYLREQQERKCRMFQQAIDDMDTAMALSQYQEDKDLYMTEQAAIYLQVGSYDEAISRCEQVLKTSPDFEDAKKILGMAKDYKGRSK